VPSGSSGIIWQVPTWLVVVQLLRAIAAHAKDLPERKAAHRPVRVWHAAPELAELAGFLQATGANMRAHKSKIPHLCIDVSKFFWLPSNDNRLYCRIPSMADG